MTRPVLAVMAGWFDGKLGADIHALLAAVLRETDVDTETGRE